MKAVRLALCLSILFLHTTSAFSDDTSAKAVPGAADWQEPWQNRNLQPVHQLLLKGESLQATFALRKETPEFWSLLNDAGWTSYLSGKLSLQTFKANLTRQAGTVPDGARLVTAVCNLTRSLPELFIPANPLDVRWNASLASSVIAYIDGTEYSKDARFRSLHDESKRFSRNFFRREVSFYSEENFPLRPDSWTMFYRFTKGQILRDIAASRPSRTGPPFCNATDLLRAKALLYEAGFNAELRVNDGTVELWATGYKGRSSHETFKEPLLQTKERFLISLERSVYRGRRLDLIAFDGKSISKSKWSSGMASLREMSEAPTVITAKTNAGAPISDGQNPLPRSRGRAYAAAMGAKALQFPLASVIKAGANGALYGPERFSEEMNQILSWEFAGSTAFYGATAGTVQNLFGKGAPFMTRVGAPLYVTTVAWDALRGRQLDWKQHATQAAEFTAASALVSTLLPLSPTGRLAGFAYGTFQTATTLFTVDAVDHLVRTRRIPATQTIPTPTAP